MPRGSNTVTVKTPFTCYRDPGVGPMSAMVDGKQTTIQGDVSGPRTDYEAGAVVTDATDEEVEAWTAAGLVEQGAAAASRPAPAVAAPRPPNPADE